MSILLTKVFDRPCMNGYETLFSRHPSHPSLTGRIGLFHEQRFLPALRCCPTAPAPLLLCRRWKIAAGFSHLCVERSAHRRGLDCNRSEPTFPPVRSIGSRELWGVEDPRITYNAGKLSNIIRGLHSYSRGGLAYSVRLTKDWRVFERLGVVNGRRTDKERPFCPEGLTAPWALIIAHVRRSELTSGFPYLARFASLGQSQLRLEAAPRGWWDANKIGMSPSTFTD